MTDPAPASTPTTDPARERTHESAPEAAPTATPVGGWTLWSVLRRTTGTLGDGDALATAVDEVPDGVVLRGLYDLTGMRADADLMIWLHGDSPEALQAELRRLRRTAELRTLEP